MKRSHSYLVKQIQARRAAHARTKGIVLASDYLRDLRECVGSGVCRRYFGEGTDLSAAIKDATSKLTFSFGDNDIKEVSGNVGDWKKLLPKGMEVPEGALIVMRNCLTTPDEDRDTDILRTAGAKPDPKMPLLWQHLHTSPIGKSLGIASHTDAKLSLWTCLLDLNELTEDAAKLCEAQVLRFSHGFRALEFKERKEGTGFEITSFEIIEESLVSVPSNVRAEVEAWARVSKGFKSDFFKKAAKKKLSPHLKNYAQGIGDGITISGLSFQDLLSLNKSVSAAATKDHDCGCGGEKNAADGSRAAADASADMPACPECGSTDVSQKDGKYTCKECGHTWAAGKAASKEPGSPSTGSVGAVAPGPTGSHVYSNSTDAELAADIIGCLGFHEVAGGFSPCDDAATLAEMTGTTTSVPLPADGTSGGGATISNPPKRADIPSPKTPTATRVDAKNAVRNGVKMYLGTLEGSFQWIQCELQEDAARYLMATGCDVDRYDCVYVAAVFDGYALVCVSGGGGGYYDAPSSLGTDEDFYKISFTVTDGDVAFTGQPMPVEVRTTTNLVELTGPADAVMNGAASHKPWSLKTGLQGWNLRKQISKAIALHKIREDKAGRVLSAANAKKLADCVGDLEELSAMEGLPRAATALAKRVTDTLSAILDSATPADEPTDVTSALGQQKAAEAILDAEDPGWLRRLATAAETRAEVLELNKTGSELLFS